MDRSEDSQRRPSPYAHSQDKDAEPSRRGIPYRAPGGKSTLRFSNNFRLPHPKISSSYCRTCKRVAKHTADARKKLVESGHAEAKAMREILETQKKYIGESLPSTINAISDNEHWTLATSRKDLRNRINRRYWGKRLVSLETNSVPSQTAYEKLQREGNPE